MNRVMNWGPQSETTLCGTVEFPDIAEVQVSSSSSRDGGHHLDEVGLLAYGVDNHHDSIISSRLWKFHDEVHADDFPMFLWDQEGLKFSDGESALCLGSETYWPMYLDMFGH